MLLLMSCSGQVRPDTDGKTVITLSDYKEVRVDTPFELFDGDVRYMRLSTGDGYGFSKVYKAEYINNNIYILDQNHYRLVVFDDNGQPVYKLDYKGRGPNEYLQITDFAVAPDGTSRGSLPAVAL